MTLRRFFIAWIFIPGFFHLHAQQTYLGLSGGYHVNGAWIEHSLRGVGYSIQLRQEVIPGIHAGVQLKHYNEVKSFRKLHSGIQVSAYYFQRGWQQGYVLTEGPITRMNYINIPVDALIFLGNERNRWFFLLGIYGDWLVDYDLPTKPSAEVTLDEDFYTFDEARGDKKYGYGFNGAAGLHKTWGRQSIEFGAFFSYTLSNFIYTNRISDETPDVSNLWSAGIRVAYLIPLGLK